MNIFDYIVIGAGPAGLQLGYELQRRGRDYLILEAADVAGSFFRRFPRHRQLISINKVNTDCGSQAIAVLTVEAVANVVATRPVQQIQ
jgi:cation diffusion facilitator CzcD-associated flavoprotein CzcO